jgi:hypothetical protein
MPFSVGWIENQMEWKLNLFNFFSAEEKKEVLEFFKEEVDNLRVPGKVRCDEFLAHKKSSHSWKIIKNCVHSKVSAMKR